MHTLWGEFPAVTAFSLLGITGAHDIIVILVCNFFLSKDSGRAPLFPVTEKFCSMKLKVFVTCMVVACGHAGVLQGATSKVVKDLG